jgi:ribosomal-protein-alanine N-acetyltransferase
MPAAAALRLIREHRRVRYSIRPMTAADATAIAAWRYRGEYGFYDVDQDPDDLAELLDPAEWGTRYFAADAQGGLAGYFVFKQSGDEVEIGLGLRPDLTGRGLGAGFLDAGLRFAADRYHPARTTLSVAAFNARAITVYERAGFRAVERYEHTTNGGLHPFIRMERP